MHRRLTAAMAGGFHCFNDAGCEYLGRLQTDRRHARFPLFMAAAINTVDSPLCAMARLETYRIP